MPWVIIVQLTDGGRRMYYRAEGNWTTVRSHGREWRPEDPNLDETMTDLRAIGLTPMVMSSKDA